MNDWGDLIARARGLSGHLLAPAQLAPLASSPGLPALAAQLASLGLIPSAGREAPLDEHALELLLRRRAASQLELLARWAGPREALLAPIFEDEDRRTLRALIRGALGGVAPEVRRAGLIPTPALPLRAIEELSAAGDVSTIAAALIAWGHPFGAALLGEARRQRPDLLGLEMALTRAFAARAAKLARRLDAAMALFVARTIDLENLRAALVLTAGPGELEPAALFVDGGALITAGDLTAAANARSAPALAARLEPRVRKTPLAALLNAGPRGDDDAALEAMVAEFARIARGQPLGLAPVILFSLRQRAELRALLRLLWRLALGAPPPPRAHPLGGAA